MALNTIFAAATAFLVIICATHTEAKCDLTMENLQEKIGQYTMECVAHDPALMLEVMEHMNSEDSMAKIDFVCSKLPQFVKFMLCLKEKVIDCIPEQNARNFLDETFNYDRLMDGMSFVCKNKTVLMNNAKCFDQSAQQQFMSCYVGKIQGLAGTLMSGSMDIKIKDAMCQVINLEESCIKKFHGSCGQDYVKLIVQLLEKFFPTSGCPKKDLQDLAKNSMLGSILVHGQPLQFQPYKVIGGEGKK